MDLGEFLTVTVQSLESLATDFLEYEHFLCFGVIVKDGSLHNCSLYIRSSNLYGAFCINEKNLVELYGFSVLCLEAVYEDIHSSLYFELLACNVYDCVHCTKKLIKSLSLRRLDLPSTYSAFQPLKFGTAKIRIFP